MREIVLAALLRVFGPAQLSVAVAGRDERQRPVQIESHFANRLPQHVEFQIGRDLQSSLREVVRQGLSRERERTSPAGSIAAHNSEDGTRLTSQFNLPFA